MKEKQNKIVKTPEEILADTKNRFNSLLEEADSLYKQGKEKKADQLMKRRTKLIIDLPAKLRRSAKDGYEVPYDIKVEVTDFAQAAKHARTFSRPSAQTFLFTPHESPSGTPDEFTQFVNKVLTK